MSHPGVKERGKWHTIHSHDIEQRNGLTHLRIDGSWWSPHVFSSLSPYKYTLHYVPLKRNIRPVYHHPNSAFKKKKKSLARRHISMQFGRLGWISGVSFISSGRFSGWQWAQQSWALEFRRARSIPEESGSLMRAIEPNNRAGDIPMPMTGIVCRLWKASFTGR